MIGRKKPRATGNDSVAVGVGTALLDAKAIAAGDYGVLRANAARIVANVRAARGA